MVQGVYVASVAAGSGKSLVALGLADALHRRTGRLGFFRPFANAAEAPQDPVVAMMGRLYELGRSRCRGGMSLDVAQADVAAGREDELLSFLLMEYAEVSAGCDAVIVDGSDMRGSDAGREFDLNRSLAGNLGLPVLIVVGARGLPVSQTASAVEGAIRHFGEAHCQILAVVVNRADPGTLPGVSSAVAAVAGEIPSYVLPEVGQISTPTVADVAASLGIVPMAGSPELDRDVGRINVAGMSVDNFLGALHAGDLVIVPGDRSDVMAACVASSLTPELPTPAGIVLADGLFPGGPVLPLLAQAPFPVFRVPLDSYDVARDAAAVRSEIHTGENRKLAAALGVWSRHVNEAEMLDRLALPRPVTMTPLRFLNEVIEKARKQERSIVLAEGDDVRVLRAAEILRRRDVCRVTVLGNLAAVHELAAAHGVDVSGLQVLDPAGSPFRERFAAEYCRLRSHKGMTMERAREIMLDRAYFGTMMVQLGEADGMVSGAAHTTANTIRPALEFVKGRDGAGLVSSVFFMLFPDRVFVYGDCAVVPEPNAEQLAEIAIASAATASRFGVEPRVAMLSYSTGGSGTGTAVDKVRRATELVRAARPDLPVEGPIQYDAAVDATIASSKLPASAVAGKATVFIFPDLNTGNNTYKAVEQSSGAVAVGPILQGLRKPINDLSRGSTVEDIINTVAITAVQAQEPG